MSALLPALLGLRDLLDARRLVLWEVDVDLGAADPRVATGEAPPAQPPGTPLAWCAAERQPLRLDPRPGWAIADVRALPVGDPRAAAVLTIEADGQRADRPDRENAAIAILDSVLALDDADRRARTSEARFKAAMAFLHVLSSDGEAATLPERLAHAARDVTGADGAIAAVWDGEAGVGRVIARSGRAGGPEPGTVFDAAGGDLGLAARAGVTLRRGSRDAAPRPLAAKGLDGWSGAPADSAIVPLLEAGGVRGGLVACWASVPLDDEAIELLRALGPLLAVQLRHSLDLVRFRQEAGHDTLTGLPNRAALEQRLRDERIRYDRYRRYFALLVLDIDHFKRINDAHGHPAGDAVLIHLAGILRSVLREVDMAARLGGEEFVVVLPETLVHQAAEVAERIRAAVQATPARWDGRTLPFTVSLGAGACPESTDDPDRLLAAADQALYAAKEGGRNRVAVAAPRGDQAVGG